MSRETKPFRLLTMAFTLGWSVSGLTLRRTMCSTVDWVDMVDLMESEYGLRLAGMCLGDEKVRESGEDKKGRALTPRHGIVSIVSEH